MKDIGQLLASTPQKNTSVFGAGDIKADTAEKNTIFKTIHSYKVTPPAPIKITPSNNPVMRQEQTIGEKKEELADLMSLYYKVKLNQFKATGAIQPAFEPAYSNNINYIQNTSLDMKRNKLLAIDRHEGKTRKDMNKGTTEQEIKKADNPKQEEMQSIDLSEPVKAYAEGDPSKITIDPKYVKGTIENMKKIDRTYKKAQEAVLTYMKDNAHEHLPIQKAIPKVIRDQREKIMKSDKPQYIKDSRLKNLEVVEQRLKKHFTSAKPKPSVGTAEERPSVGTAEAKPKQKQKPKKPFILDDDEDRPGHHVET